MEKTNYKITKDCFVGNVGDNVTVDWNGMDGANWVNHTQGTMGCPFIETDCVKRLGGDF
jgi:hypothetical protein